MASPSGLYQLVLLLCSRAPSWVSSRLQDELTSAGKNNFPTSKLYSPGKIFLLLMTVEYVKNLYAYTNGVAGNLVGNDLWDTAADDHPPHHHLQDQLEQRGSRMIYMYTRVLFIDVIMIS